MLQEQYKLFIVEFTETLIYVFLDLFLNALGDNKETKVKEMLFEVKREEAMQTLLIAQDFFTCITNLDEKIFKEIRIM